MPELNNETPEALTTPLVCKVCARTGIMFEATLLNLNEEVTNEPVCAKCVPSLNWTVNTKFPFTIGVIRLPEE